MPYYIQLIQIFIALKKISQVEHFDQRMKKILSIAVAFLMMLSGLQITISRHYCGGKLAETKVSAIGHLASCGMEGKNDECHQPGDHIKSHCCDSQVSVYALDHDFAPSISELSTVEQPVLQLIFLPKIQNLNAQVAYERIYTDVSPPTCWLVSDVNLSDIRVFRI